MPGNEHARTANGNGFNLGDGIVTDGGEDTRPTVGQFNYADVREDGGYLADKTVFIDRVLTDQSKVLLFTRPRRFGKSINLTMLDAFLNIRHRGNRWFEGTTIDRMEEHGGARNAFPVVYLNFQRVADRMNDDPGRSLAGIINEALQEHDYLLDSEALRGYQKRNLEKALEDTDACQDPSVPLMLTRYLHMHHGTAPVILIDEYDAPLQNYLDTDAYPMVQKTMKVIYTTLLKDNPHFHKGVLMGVMPVGRNSLLSGLNNVWTSTMTYPGEYADCFGMTADEVARVCEEAGMTHRFGEVCDLYDGYVSGDAHVFNPYSVMCFARTGELRDWWVATGTNTVIAELMSRGDDAVRSDVLRLTAKETVTRRVDDKIVYPPSGRTSEMSADGVFGLLLHAGYLTCTGEDIPGGTMDLRIPNEEVRQEFRSNLSVWLGPRGVFASAFVRAVLRGAPDDVESEALALIRNMDENARVPENVYHYFLAGALTGQDTHDVVPEFHSGFGVADVGMIPRDDGDAAVVEFKVIGENDDPDAVAEEAIGQARKRRYAKWVKGDDALLYGIAVGKGTVVVRFERRSDPEGT